MSASHLAGLTILLAFTDCNTHSAADGVVERFCDDGRQTRECVYMHVVHPFPICKAVSMQRLSNRSGIRPWSNGLENQPSTRE